MFDRDYQIRGMHATYWKTLCKTPTDKVGVNPGGQFKIFERYVDAYMVAPLLGCLYGKKGSKDLPDSDDDAGMLAAVLIANQQRLTYIYRIIMLTDKSTGLSEDERIDRAFRDDTNDEAVKNNMQLFNDYFLGGLELLYDAFVLNCTTDDDYINKIYEYVSAFKKDQNIDYVKTDNLVNC